MKYEIPDEIEMQIRTVSMASGFNGETVRGDAILLGLVHQTFAAVLNGHPDEFLCSFASMLDPNDLGRIERIRDGSDKLLKRLTTNSAA